MHQEKQKRLKKKKDDIEALSLPKINEEVDEDDNLFAASSSLQGSISDFSQHTQRHTSVIEPQKPRMSVKDFLKQKQR